MCLLNCTPHRCRPRADGSKDVFLHISAVESAGLQSPADGQKVEYEIVSGRDGKTSAVSLRYV